MRTSELERASASSASARRPRHGPGGPCRGAKSPRRASSAPRPRPRGPHPCPQSARCWARIPQRSSRLPRGRFRRPGRMPRMSRGTPWEAWPATKPPRARASGERRRSRAPWGEARSPCVRSRSALAPAIASATATVEGRKMMAAALRLRNQELPRLLEAAYISSRKTRKSRTELKIDAFAGSCLAVARDRVGGLIPIRCGGRSLALI